MKNLKSIPLTLMLTVIIGCSRSASQNEPQQPPLPTNEATAKETSTIELYKAEIASVAKELGVDLDLERIPIILSSRDDLPHAGNSEKYAGLCIYDENGKGRAIVLTRQELELDLYKEKLHKEREITPRSFLTLLHEIGHCYFNRKHDDKILDGGHFLLSVTTSKETYKFQAMPASIMTELRIDLPYPLKKYYIAEILDVFRAKSISEIADFTDTDLVPVE